MFSTDGRFKAGLSLVTAVALSGIVVAAGAGCREGVLAGSVQDVFGGIGRVEPMSPTTARISWQTNYRYKSYLVYGSHTSEPLADRIFDNAIIENLQAGREYTFSVVAVNGNERSGYDLEKTITMPSEFQGIADVTKNADDDLVVTWNYDQRGFRFTEFYVYYKKWADPSSANTNGWALEPEWSVVTTEEQVVFQGLEGSTRYHFMVHARYADESYSRDMTALTGMTESTFRRPTITLPERVIGSLPFVRIDLADDPLFPAEYFRSQAFWTDPDTGTRVPVSDPIYGEGTMVFTPSADLGRGLISGLSVEVTYDDGSLNETYIDDGKFTYIKSQSDQLDLPPEENMGSGAAYVGKAIATGDFNCDGEKDIAIGMPNGSVGSVGVKNANAGAVLVYYSSDNGDGDRTLTQNVGGTPAFEPATPGEDPQIITFDDLPADAYFGFSLASGGNLNGDKLGGTGCEDLIVGAHGLYNSAAISGASTRGQAFVFFGSRDGLTAPAHLSDFPENVETCDGLAVEASCTAVRLTPDYSIWPQSRTNNAAYKPTWGGSGSNWDNFGYAVSFIGDFNADGFDDLAVGAPWGDWDGGTNGLPSPANSIIADVGYIAVFFGSRYGLGYEKPFASNRFDIDTTEPFRWVKVYAPQPQPAAYFGMAIHGGADVDGKFRVVSPDGSTTHGGSDMIVGAPGHPYYDPDDIDLQQSGPGGAGNADNTESLQFAEGGWGRGVMSPGLNFFGVMQSFGGGTPAPTATGAAFLFFGRSWLGGSAPALGAASGDRDMPRRGDFWSCGTRGHFNADIHLSCLVSTAGTRVLFPRRGDSMGFGSAVALVGAKSLKKPDNQDYVPGVDPVALNPKIDPNADGYAEAIVVAHLGDSVDPIAGTSANTGVIWQYFGNPSRVYESGASGAGFYTVDIGGDATAKGEYRDNDPACTAFTNPASSTQLMQCAPTIIRSNSIEAGAQMGLSQEAIDVGDVTADGLLDIVVGAPYDNTSGTQAGAIFAFTSVAGQGISSNFKKLLSTSGDDYDRLGWAVGIGNFDGDATGGGRPYNDVVAGAPFDDVPVNLSATYGRAAGGEVHLFLTGGSTLGAVKDESNVQIGDTLATPQEYGYHNTRIVGDVNGDGYDDAVTRMKSYDNAGNPTYDAVVYYGSELGLITSTYCVANQEKVFIEGSEDPSECYPAVDHLAGITQDNIVLPQLIRKPNNMGNLWSFYSYGAGDINRDGFEDVLFWDGSYTTLMYYGTAVGLQAGTNPAKAPATNDPQIISQVLQPTYTSSTFISTVANSVAYENYPFAHGDFNKDGFSDLVIASPAASHPGPSNDPADPAEPGTGSVDWICTNNPMPVGVTAQMCDGPADVPYHGIVYILYGSGDGVQTPATRGADATQDFSPFDPVEGPEEMINTYGTEGVPETPCSGDGLETAKSCLATYLRNPVFENIDYGFSKMSGHLFGATITVMDMNYDGYDDLLVGAPGYEDLDCHMGGNNPGDLPVFENYGRIFVYRGGASGITAAPRRKYFPFRDTINPATPVPHAEDTNTSITCGDPMGVDPSLGVVSADDDMDIAGMNPPGGNFVRALQWGVPNAPKNERNSYFGSRVVVAGDVNEDEFEDLLVATPMESNGSQSTIGTFRVYYGPICGLDNEPDIKLAAENNMNTQLTTSSAAILSAVTLKSAGCTRVSSPENPTTATGVKPPVQLAYVRDGLASERWGAVVSGGRKNKADVNGDEIDDILVGTWAWSNASTSQTYHGRGVVYFGSNGGLFATDYPNPTVVESGDGKFNPFSLVPTWSGQDLRFFEMNVSAGDVNADGTVDFMVPSRTSDGVQGVQSGVDLGAFFVFY